MTYEKYKAERCRYEAIALPTNEDFKRYTRAFFGWIDNANARIRAKWPELFRLREPLFDNNDNGKEIAA